MRNNFTVYYCTIVFCSTSGGGSVGLYPTRVCLSIFVIKKVCSTARVNCRHVRAWVKLTYIPCYSLPGAFSAQTYFSLHGYSSDGYGQMDKIHDLFRFSTGWNVFGHAHNTSVRASVQFVWDSCCCWLVSTIRAISSTTSSPIDCGTSSTSSDETVDSPAHKRARYACTFNPDSTPFPWAKCLGKDQHLLTVVFAPVILVSPTEVLKTSASTRIELFISLGAEAWLVHVQ